jgi:hypothetical protein
MGGRGRGRERRREGSSPRGSNSGDHHLQNLGHHGREREMGERDREREVTAREKSNEPNRSGGGGRMGWAGAPGARGPDRARPHRGSKPTARTTTKRSSIANRNL